MPDLAGRGVTASERRAPVVVGSERATTQAARPVGSAPPAESDLAVLVLQTSWALADAAHDLPAGRMSARHRAELADTLQALGYVLRVSAVPDAGQRLPDAGQRRGWCVASCGCSLDVPPGGGVHVDCAACEPIRPRCDPQEPGR